MGIHRPIRTGAGDLGHSHSPGCGDYKSGQVANIIKNYQELRSAVELVATRHEGTGGGGPRTGKEEVLCTLIDLDQALDHLSPRQKQVLKLLKQGYSYEQIGSRLGVRLVTVKFHAHHGIFRLTNYLNLG